MQKITILVPQKLTIVHCIYFEHTPKPVNYGKNMQYNRNSMYNV